MMLVLTVRETRSLSVIVIIIFCLTETDTLDKMDSQLNFPGIRRSSHL